MHDKNLILEILEQIYDSAKSIRHSKIPSPIPLVVEKLPCSIRTNAVATLAAAGAFSRLNQLA